MNYPVSLLSELISSAGRQKMMQASRRQQMLQAGRQASKQAKKYVSGKHTALT